jgi:hypothetical protein
MATRVHWRMIALATGIAGAGLLAGPSGHAWAQRPATEEVRIDERAIGGIVTGNQGPEAGVWVIAETSALPTKFAKIVVTHDRGRYVIRDLPTATYKHEDVGSAASSAVRLLAYPKPIYDRRVTTHNKKR